ncbi:hypothetical protein Tco_0511782 [Tanacetum coccineum]
MSSYVALYCFTPEQGLQEYLLASQDAILYSLRRWYQSVGQVIKLSDTGDNAGKDVIWGPTSLAKMATKIVTDKSGEGNVLPIGVEEGSEKLPNENLLIL